MADQVLATCDGTLNTAVINQHHQLINDNSSSSSTDGGTGRTDTFMSKFTPLATCHVRTHISMLPACASSSLASRALKALIQSLVAVVLVSAAE